jgi:hypothetical protein
MANSWITWCEASAGIWQILKHPWQMLNLLPGLPKFHIPKLILVQNGKIELVDISGKDHA